MNGIGESPSSNDMNKHRSPPRLTSSQLNVVEHLTRRWQQGGSATERLFVDLSLATTVQAVSRGLGHDLRNRLQVISMVGQTVTDSAADRSLVERLGPMIVSAAHEVEEDLNRLSLIQSRDEGESAVIVVADVVTDSVRLIERLDAAPPITVRLPDNLPAGAACYHELWHALLNLMLNSVEAQQDTDDGTITISGTVDGGVIRLTVEDSGPGVPAHIGTQIFDPFFTTRQIDRHLGIGVPVAQLLARRWNGSLKLSNETDGGAQLVLSIPAVDPTTSLDC